ncbi:adenylate/guanylate cyclase domain-containing protein [Arcobacteraceae bacterium]|nr:adenylate/guanylate cyclase domain-containing protein [Arcobacteraceae bacterium]
MKGFKKFFIYFFLSIFIFLGVATFYLYIPKTLESFDNRLRDYMFISRGDIPNSQNIIIIDIDDKSIKQLGQWPWNREILSQLLINLNNKNIGLVAFDIVFAESDRTNASNFIKKYKLKVDKDIIDNDTLFATTIAQTPTILGYQFQLSKDDFLEQRAPNIPAIFIEKNINDTNKAMSITAHGTILNIPLIQENAYSSGFFNNIPDNSGIIRSVPLVIKYDEQIYPSLALEVIRAITDTKRVYINYDQNGIENIKVADFIIPTDRYGRSIVNFRGGAKNFKYISAVDIINNNFDPKDTEGKIALIGTSAAGLLDLRATPFDSIYPGVEVHANVIDNILTEDYIFKPSWVDGLNMLHMLLLIFFIVFLVAYLPLGASISLITLTFIVDMYILYYILFTNGLILNIFFPIVTILVSFISAGSINYLLEQRQTKAIKSKFASKVSKEVMESLIANPDNDTFAAMEKEVTVFFSDVRGFTNISEAMPNAKILIEFMNEYMDPMTDVIIKENGTVDKFIGDAIMAYWNAPGDVPDHPQRALKATLDQLHMLDELNKKLAKDERFSNVVNLSKEKNIPIIDIGIGLNTGVVIAGEMGSSQRSDYTVIGDPVNLGARLESLCKYYNSKCNISNFTKEKLNDDDYIFRFLDLVTVKGKHEPIEIWQVIDYNLENPKHTLYDVTRERLDEELLKYHTAIKLYKNSKFTEALTLFQEINQWKDKTNNNIYTIYIERCEHYIKEPPVNFTGVFEHTTKG